jgi:CIC family chloride channel protein
MARLTVARLALLQRLRLSEWQRMLLLAAIIGVLGAVATIGFRELILLAERLAYGRSDGLVRIATALPWWQRLLMPAAGGVLAGALLTRARRVTAPERGADYMEAIALGDGDLNVRASCLRALSSAATVASGGAIGREGSMVQLAALCGSLIGRWRRAPVPRRRLLVACGAAAGVATAYNAPIAGALFVAEIVLRSVAIESLGPLLVAAVTANVLASTVLGFKPVYQMPAFVLPAGISTLVLAGIGIAAGLLAPLFLAVLDRSRAGFQGWRAPLWLKLGTGGLLVGGISVLSPAVWGNGYSVVNSLLQGGWLWQALLLVLGLKVLAVAATTGSGAVGGVFTPTLFVGAVVGSLVGGALQWLWPGWLPVPASVAVGMGAFLAACTHAPLMSVLMIFEMTENYGVITPLMLACVLAYFIASVLRPASIYSGHTGTRQHAPALTMAIDFLREGAPTITPSQSAQALEQVFLQFRWQHTYVVDADGHFLGAVSLHDFAPCLRTLADPGQPWPDTLLRRDYPRVQHDTAAWQVLEAFASHPGERLPVLDDAGKLQGYLTKTDLVMLFRERLAGG